MRPALFEQVAVDLKKLTLQVRNPLLKQSIVKKSDNFLLKNL